MEILFKYNVLSRKMDQAQDETLYFPYIRTTLLNMCGACIGIHIHIRYTGTKSGNLRLGNLLS